MCTFALVSALVGAVLGVWFQFFVIVPVAGIGLAMVALIQIAHGGGIWSMIVVMAVSLIGLQFGYLAGKVMSQIVLQRLGKAGGGRHQIAPSV